MAATTTRTTIPLRQSPFPRTPTPHPHPYHSAFRTLSKPASYVSLNDSVMASPVLESPLPSPPSSPSLSLGEQEAPMINVISPTTASHRSVYSEIEDDGLSPRGAGKVFDEENEGEAKEIRGIGGLNGTEGALPGDELLYDVRMEEEGDSEAGYGGDLREVVQRMKRNIREVAIALEWRGAGEVVQELKRRARKLSEFEPREWKRLGVVGGRGSGKNGIINALLDYAYLSPEDTTGGNSASLILEYRHRPAHLNEPFGIEVEYMNSDEIKERVEELLRTFRASYTAALQGIDDLEELCSMRRASDKAWETLHSMFRNQPHFSKSFVLQYADNASKPLCTLLHEQALTFIQRQSTTANPPTWSTTALEPDECSDLLYKFTHTPLDPHTPAFWPFIRLLRVSLRSPLLASGVVLADCPSLADLDFSTRRATERYLRSCDELFAATPTTHALVDRSVPHLLNTIGTHRPLRIICTHANDILPRDVERSDPEIAWQVRLLRQHIDALRKQVYRSTALRRQGVPGAPADEARHRDLLDEVQFGLKKFLVERRNSRVAGQLIERYWQRVQGGDLKVFFVDAADYAEYRYEEQGRAEGRLGLSGVVDLRRYCRGVAGQEVCEEAVGYLEDEVPAFLEEVRVWITGCSRTVDSPEFGVRDGQRPGAIGELTSSGSEVQNMRKILTDEFASAIVHPIRDYRSTWRRTALETSKSWNKLDPHTHASLCRYQGTHASHNWNDELLTPLRTYLHSNWDFYHEFIRETEAEILHIITRYYSSLHTTAHTSSPRLNALLPTLPHRLNTLTRTLHTSFAHLLSRTSDLETDALSAHSSSFIAGIMAPAYHAAAAAAAATPPDHSLPFPQTPDPNLPREIDARRKHLVTAHISSARIFPRLASFLEAAHAEIVRSCLGPLFEAVQREIAHVARMIGCVDGSARPWQEERSAVGAFGAFVEELEERLRDVEDVYMEAGGVLGETDVGGVGGEEEEEEEEGRGDGVW